MQGPGRGRAMKDHPVSHRCAAPRRRLRVASAAILLALVPVLLWARSASPHVKDVRAAEALQEEARRLDQTWLDSPGRHGSANGTAAGSSSSTERSFFLPWIKRDLSRWSAAGGITRALVDDAQARVQACTSWSPQPFWIRFQIVGGRLYVEHWDAPQGHYPAELGRGWVGAKGRLPYAILALMDLMREFPGEVPYMDAVVGLQDTPCVAIGNGTEALPPVFGLTGTGWASDIPFPDFTYWGHEVGLGLEDDQGRWIHGWDGQLDHYTQKWRYPLWDKVPRMVWRGRTHDPHDRPRKEFAECRLRLLEQNDTRSTVLFNTLPDGEGPVNLDSMCRYMYQVYLEAAGYSSSFKHRMACGSVFLTPYILFYEFWTRALEEGRHYLVVGASGNDTDCVVAAKKVKAMNAFMYGAEAPSISANTDGNSTVSQRQQGAPTVAPAPVGSRLEVEQEWQEMRLGKAAGRQQFPWGSQLTPQEIADEGRTFLQAHVRMRDVRLYLRDVLREYSDLMRYKPQPGERSRCYTGKMLLKEFAIPFKEDAQGVLQQYPWLADWDPGCPKKWWGSLWG